MPRVLLAPDKFKGSLTAARASAALAAGLASARSDVQVRTVPVADGGDGLLDAVISAGFEPVEVTAVDAVGLARRTRYARRGERAVVELAEIAGLATLASPAPTTATSAGLGQAIAAALEAGCTSVVVGIGGSASTDGGVGMLQALGALITDAGGEPVRPGVDVARAVSLDLSGLHPGLREASLLVACDVDNPLTGPRGAAAVYGPQKGASPAQVRELDAALAHWARLVGGTDRELPGAGAAGGIGFGAAAVLGARLVPGADLVLDLTGFDAALAGADLVVTGEGSLDEQTLHGKAPAAVARRAAAAGVPVVAVAGRCSLDRSQLGEAGIGRAYALTELAGSAEDAMARATELLREVGARIARADLPATP